MSTPSDFKNPDNNRPDTWVLPPEVVQGLRALDRFVYIETRDEFGFLRRWKNTVNKISSRSFLFNSEMGGLRPFELGFRDLQTWPRPKAEHGDIKVAMSEAFVFDPKDDMGFYVILDGDRYIQDLDVQRMVLNQSFQLEADSRTVKCFYFVGPKITVPVKLRPQFNYIVMPTLSKEEVQAMVLLTMGMLHDFRFEEEGYDYLMGLTPVEIDRAISHAVVCGKREDRLKDRAVKAKFIKEFREKLDNSMLT